MRSIPLMTVAAAGILLATVLHARAGDEPADISVRIPHTEGSGDATASGVPTPSRTKPDWEPVRLNPPAQDYTYIHNTVEAMGRDSSKPVFSETAGPWVITGFVVSGNTHLQCAAERKTVNGSSFAYLIEAVKGDPEFHPILLVPSPAPMGARASMTLSIDRLVLLSIPGTVREQALEMRVPLDKRSEVHKAIRSGNWLSIIRTDKQEAMRVDLHGSAEALASLAACTDLGLAMIKR